MRDDVSHDDIRSPRLPRGNGDRMPPPPSRARRTVFWLILVCSLGAFCEVAARIGYYVLDGFNPYYLVFGFIPDTEFHSVQAAGYSKFQPSSVKHQKVADRVIGMRINASGFRRTGDSDPIAAEADFRVATLGASSTFGYYVEDGETYPAELERLLKAARPDRAIEVYNLGIPHLQLEHIVELARHELPAIKPHVVTLYSGYNNVGQTKVRKGPGVVGVKNWLYFHSVFYRILRPAIKRAYFSWVKTTNRDIGQLGHLSLPLELSRDRVEELRRQYVAEFAAHLDALHRLIEGMDAQLVLMTQNYSLARRGDSGLTGQVRSYPEEVRFVEQLLAENGKISAVQASLLVHRDLMNHVRDVARRRGLVLVDGIAAMSQDPSEMASGIHLSRQGNRWVARALYQQILPLLNDE